MQKGHCFCPRLMTRGAWEGLRSFPVLGPPPPQGVATRKTKLVSFQNLVRAKPRSFNLWSIISFNSPPLKAAGVRQ